MIHKLKDINDKNSSSTNRKMIILRYKNGQKYHIVTDKLSLYKDPDRPVFRAVSADANCVTKNWFQIHRITEKDRDDVLNEWISRTNGVKRGSR